MLPRADPYATHLPVLARVVTMSHGPVLELGAGWYSTPLLHWLCLPGGCVTLDGDALMLVALDWCATSWHHLRHVQDWDAAPEPDRPGWAVALVDHAPAERRKVELRRLRGNARYVVVHDSDEALYGLEPVAAQYRWRWEWRAMRPATAVLSDFADPAEMFG